MRVEVLPRVVEERGVGPLRSAVRRVLPRSVAGRAAGAAATVTAKVLAGRDGRTVLVVLAALVTSASMAVAAPAHAGTGLGWLLWCAVAATGGVGV